MILNPKKCKEMVISFRKTVPTYNVTEVDHQPFERVQAVKILGLTIRNDLKWNYRIENIIQKAANAVTTFVRNYLMKL